MGMRVVLAAVSALFTATPGQRCVVHKQRNGRECHSPSGAQRGQRGISRDFQTGEERRCAAQSGGMRKPNTRSVILKRSAECREDKEHLLTFYAFPPVMHRYIRSTNATPSFFSNVRQRTDQIDSFTTETSCLTIVWAVMQDIHVPRIPVS